MKDDGELYLREGGAGIKQSIETSDTLVFNG